MGRPHLVTALGLSAVFVLVSCGPDLVAPGTVEESPIWGGTTDTTDVAIMALIHQTGTTQSSVCSGTVIAKSGASGIYLTAAHCVVANNGTAVTIPVKVASASDIFIVPGNDWQAGIRSSQYFDATAVAVHPSYDGSVNSPFDAALVRFAGATPAMPTIPALAAAEDTLKAPAGNQPGSSFTLVGYGETDTNKNNSVRRQVDRTVETISDRQFLYDQKDLKGACSGDSGGPALLATPGGLRVAGVTSFGDADCTAIGVSVRVSPLAAFIQSFISGTPLTLTCDECTAAAVAPGNACVAQSDACAPGSACDQFVTCAQPCTSQGCVSTCQSRFAAGATAYDAVAKCQCTSCATPCAQVSGCKPYLVTSTTPVIPPNPPPTTGACGGVTDARAACSSCIANSCCAEATACAADAICASCLVQSSAGCRIDTAFTNLLTCEAKCAGAPCSATTTTPTGGASGNGGTSGGGAPGTGGAAGATGIGVTEGKSGCSCDVAGGSRSGFGGALLLAACFACGARRRRARR